jgi:transcriptional regulator with XRE-family HTH domain
VNRAWLADLRKQKNLTQMEIAQRAGITQSAYNHIELGRRAPTVKTAKALAQILEIEWVEFFNE